MTLLSDYFNVVIAAYTAAVCVKHKGVPASISATFYKLEHPYWFLATMWLTAGLLMPVILDISKPNTEFLAFLACAGMMLRRCGSKLQGKDGRKSAYAGLSYVSWVITQ